jgi:hypothetical protein
MLFTLPVGLVKTDLLNWIKKSGWQRKFNSLIGSIIRQLYFRSGKTKRKRLDGSEHVLELVELQSLLAKYVVKFPIFTKIELILNRLTYSHIHSIELHTERVFLNLNSIEIERSKESAYMYFSCLFICTMFSWADKMNFVSRHNLYFSVNYVSFSREKKPISKPSCI